MKKVLVTGAAGFIGKNLVAALRRREDVSLSTITSDDDWPTLAEALLQADVIYHLAGINRPKTEDEFTTGNAGLTLQITSHLEELGRKSTIVLPSSIQAELDNPYGRSKKAAEESLIDYARRTGASVAIYRLPNVFGKWSRPNYNTVVATFCYNIARDIDITISDPERELELVYIDDVVNTFLRHLDSENEPQRIRYSVPRTFRITLGELANRIRTLHQIRPSLVVPNLADELTLCLHATYLSFLSKDAFAYPAKLNTDNRGWLFELLKSEHFGQIFVSKTQPGITGGDHYHDSKLEKFCVIQGEAVIRFRHIYSQEILEYLVSGNDIKVVDIPPGYTHSIENIGQNEMIFLFWANQIFSPQQPDTFWEKVKS